MASRSLRRLLPPPDTNTASFVASYGLVSPPPPPPPPASSAAAATDEEARAVRERLERWPAARLAEEGVALFGLAARHEGRFYAKDAIVRLSAPGPGGLPPHHRFGQGDMVTISARGPLEDGADAVEGVVLEAARGHLLVVVARRDVPLVTAAAGSRWRLDLSANEVAYRRATEAVTVFAAALGERSSASARPAHGARQRPDGGRRERKQADSGSGSAVPSLLGEGVAALAAVVLEAEKLRITGDHVGSQPRKELAALPAAAMPSQVAPGGPLGQALAAVARPPADVRIGSAAVQGRAVEALLAGAQNGDSAQPAISLNASQVAAIAAATARSVTLWQGPPGTGKTRTLLHLMAVLRAMKRGPILACADSNVAVDNLVEGLLALGLQPVRLGRPVKVKAALRDATLEALVAAHPTMRDVAKLRGRLQLLRADAYDRSGAKRTAAARLAASVWGEAESLEAQVVSSILDRADMVVATCVGAGDPVLTGRRFATCVIDEAAQATEPSALIALVASGASSVVLVGDPRQLPPTVLSQEALQSGLAVSLFERLQACGIQPLLLNTQYRMHPAIAAFPSKAFYDSKLQSQPRPSDRPAALGFAWPAATKPLAFVDCTDGQERGAGVVKIVTGFMEADNLEGGHEAIGIITPYQGQARLVRLIQELFQAAGPSWEGLEVKSVDGFQGREKEVIIVSTVRAGASGALGFVQDPRLLNVALTRAKRGLVVVGSARTLVSSPIWRAWLEHMRQESLYMLSRPGGQAKQSAHTVVLSSEVESTTR
eukprot:SM000141S00851  [mRNA]  locus=s141:57415:63431:- [translate_table: standard]